MLAYTMGTWVTSMLETKCFGDNFEMLVADSGCWRPISYMGKITNIMKKSPTYWFCH